MDACYQYRNDSRSHYADRRRGSGEGLHLGMLASLKEDYLELISSCAGGVGEQQQGHVTSLEQDHTFKTAAAELGQQCKGPCPIVTDNSSSRSSSACVRRTLQREQAVIDAAGEAVQKEAASLAGEMAPNSKGLVALPSGALWHLNGAYKLAPRDQLCNWRYDVWLRR